MQTVGVSRRSTEAQSIARQRAALYLRLADLATEQAEVYRQLAALEAVDAELAQAQAGPHHTSPAEPRWLKLEDFRRRWSLSKSALYERLAEGLPNEGEGRRRRIPLEAGDEWMRTHGGTRE